MNGAGLYQSGLCLNIFLKSPVSCQCIFIKKDLSHHEEILHVLGLGIDVGFLVLEEFEGVDEDSFCVLKGSQLNVEVCQVRPQIQLDIFNKYYSNSN